jgi:hypothetical protein
MITGCTELYTADVYINFYRHLSGTGLCSACVHASYRSNMRTYLVITEPERGLSSSSKMKDDEAAFGQTGEYKCSFLGLIC